MKTEVASGQQTARLDPGSLLAGDAAIDARARRPDKGDAHRGVGVIAVLATTVLASASFSLGIPGLMAIGGWGLVPGGFRWLVPVMLDGGILTFGVAATELRRKQRSARFEWAWLGALTVLSMGLQVAHVLSPVLGPQLQTAIGATLVAIFPAMVFSSTHSLLRLVWPRPEAEKKNSRRATRSVAAPESSRVLMLAPDIGQTSNTGGTQGGSSTEVRQRARRGPATNRLRDEPLVLEMRAARPQVSFAGIQARTGVKRTTAERWVNEAIASGRDDLRPVREVAGDVS